MAFPIFSLIKWKKVPTAQYIHTVGSVPSARYSEDSFAPVGNVPTARHSINPTQTQCSVGWESAHLQKSVLEARHRQTRQDTYSNDNPPIA